MRTVAASQHIQLCVAHDATTRGLIALRNNRTYIFAGYHIRTACAERCRCAPITWNDHANELRSGDGVIVYTYIWVCVCVQAACAKKRRTRRTMLGALKQRWRTAMHRYWILFVFFYIQRAFTLSQLVIGSMAFRIFLKRHCARSIVVSIY